MPDNEYEKLFDEASESDGKKEEITKTITEEVVDGKSEVDTKTEEVDESDTKHKEGENKPTYEELEQKYKSLQGMIESKQHENEDLSAKLKNFEDKLNAIDEARGVKPKPDAEENDAELEEYLSDYAYISKNEAKLRRKELEQLKKDIISEISKTYEIPINTVKKLVEEDAEVKAALHLNAIKESHEDYGENFDREDIVKWAETLSPTKKKVNMEIIENGNTDEVIDLITEYKKANGISIEKLADKSNSEDKIETKKDKRLQSLEVITGKKSPVKEGSSKKAETFEDAFAEAASAK